MNCARFIDLMDDYHGGTLDPALRVAADEHLGACRRCQADYAGLKAVLRAAAALPRERAPAHDLWPGIAARLAPRAKRQRPHGLVHYALAATVVLAVGGMAALVFRAAPPASVSLARQAPAAARPALLDPALGGGRAAFVAQLTVQGDTLSPATRAVVLRNLQVIEQALHEIDAAVERDPNDPNLRDLLTTIHQQESALIDQTQRITMHPAKRTDI